MSETELDLARRIAAGTAPSPSPTAEFTWFAMRWSGTGTAWREAHNEHVYRAPEITLTEAMAARLAGLPLIYLHPKGGDLDSDTFEKSVIGTLSFGYIATPGGIQDAAGTELWAMTRVYSAEAIAALRTGTLSTSPAVMFAPEDGNETLKLQDGSAILFEGRPFSLSHLAVVPAGVWDKGAGPSGVRIDHAQEKKMAEQDTRSDAEKQAEMVDKTLKDLSAKFDSFCSRIDALERGGRRHDAERDGWMAEDAAQCGRDDADEERERGEMVAKGEPAETAADKARQARRDRVKARKDAVRHDSARLTTEQARAARETERANIDVQARVDSAFHSWGLQAPPPMAGETTINYRIRLARHHQRHCAEPAFKDLDLGAIAATHPTALDGIERRIYADSVAASNDPTNGPEDHLTMIRKTTDAGHQVTEWRGRHTFIRNLKRPSLRATAFMLPRDGRAA